MKKSPIPTILVSIAILWPCMQTAFCQTPAYSTKDTSQWTKDDWIEWSDTFRNGGGADLTAEVAKKLGSGVLHAGIKMLDFAADCPEYFKGYILAKSNINQVKYENRIMDLYESGAGENDPDVKWYEERLRCEIALKNCFSDNHDCTEVNKILSERMKEADTDDKKSSSLIEDSAPPIVGCWNWFNGGYAEFYPNGEIYSNGEIEPTGTWEPSGNEYVITWIDGPGFVDTLRIENGELWGHNNCAQNLCRGKEEKADYFAIRGDC